WGLFGQARRRDDSIINSHTNAAEVIFDFYYENDLYRVQRSKVKEKTAQLDFFIQDDGRDWRPLTEHSLRETEARIQRTLRLDYETFTNASFFLQGKADQFAQQRPADRKRILGSILGLEEWEKYRDTAVERRRQQEYELAGIDNLLQEIETELQEEAARRQQLKLLQKQLKQLSAQRQLKGTEHEQARRQVDALANQRQLVGTLVNQLDGSQKRFQERTDLLQSRRAELRGYQQQVERADKVEADYHSWQQARQELERWEQLAAVFRRHASRRSQPLTAIESERTRLSTEIENLKAQAEQAAEQTRQIPSLQAEQALSLQAVQALTTRLEQRAALTVEQEALQETQTEALAENKRLKYQMDELKERIERLEQTAGAVCPLCDKPLTPADREQLVASLQAQGKELADRYRQNLALVREGEQRRQGIIDQLSALRQAEEELRLQQRTLDQTEHRLQQTQEWVEKWQSDGATRLQTLTRQLETEAFAATARAELTEIDAALQAVGYDPESHDRLRAAEQAGSASEAGMRALGAARAALTQLGREINSLEKELQSDESELQRLDTAVKEAVAKLAVDSTTLPDVDKLESELRELQTQENVLRSEVGGAQQRVDILEDQRSRQVEKKAQRQEISTQIARLKTLERAFGKDGIPALLIEQALPEIEAQANEILDRLTSGGMSVRFETLREYKDKRREDQRETLDILISDSVGVREYELFSGGEAFRVNFAIRLALSRVLAQRAGARLQMLVIDEGFGSQDVEGRQRLIEALNLVSADFAKVLVITHLEEMKDAFPCRIEVTKTGRGSTVSVVV
ncbi:MAG: SMC family ATPase, partial [Anaerolineaceae bacterium]|nr:SMC family ATPase [Anaerolineaceae bacterium]